jgi:glycosyltransferase involved in cell wall biosynthesis/MoaA/NifB/PqqE/SkfB family radical SAM enzyme
MNILQVIHGYPPHYMAGSEVYTRNLCRELARKHQVSVFTRVENPYAVRYEESVAAEDGIRIWRLNKPQRDYTLKDKYLDPRVDDAFRRVLDATRPDVVHFGHLSHLSTQLPIIARRERSLRTVFTVHDFWLHCFLGQLVRPDLSRCDGPSDRGCALCAQALFKDWARAEDVVEYRRHMREVCDHVDLFIAPSRTVEAFFLAQGIERSKIRYARYGFDTSLVPKLSRAVPARLRFGFMGRVIPVKGIQLLLRAFARTRGDASLEVWGAAEGLRWLEELSAGDPRVHFHGPYANDQLGEVLQTFDVLITPSLWLENSPLVIQEAMLAGIPVITSDAGGMAELVEEGVSGWRFPLGDEEALRATIQRVVDHPALLANLTPGRTHIRTIAEDAASCEAVYSELARAHSRPAWLTELPAPWRVTFVTNPGLCNLRCLPCDTHSPYATSRHSLPVLDFSLVEQTVHALAPRGLREIIPSTMGEPLLYPNFDRLLELADRTRVRVNLTTNGTFPLGGVDRWASLLLPVVSDVKFSVNAMDPNHAARIMTGLNSEAQLAGIERYLSLRDDFGRAGRRSSVTLQVTLMEANLEELPRILRWAIRRGVDRLKAHHLWVTWSQLAGESLRRSPESRARWNSVVAELEAIASNELRADGTPIQLDNIRLLSDAACATDDMPTRCPFLGQEAWIEADGTFQVCCCPSQKRAAFGYFGSVRERPFMELWTSRAYREFVAQWGDHPNCAECNMRRPAKEQRHAA